MFRVVLIAATALSALIFTGCVRYVDTSAPVWEEPTYVER